MTDNLSTIDIRTSVRTRPGMYFGCTSERGVVHVVNELVSNGIDQFLHKTATRVAVDMDGETINYSDDGPGLPYDTVGPGGTSLAEHYLTCYHTTPTADDHTPHIHILSHGLGLVCVNAASEQFDIKTWRSGCLWEQRFTRGVPVDVPRIVGRDHGSRGTTISIRLDSEVFHAKLPCPRTLRRLMFESAHLFPGITLGLGHEVFHAPGGLGDLASLYYSHTAPCDLQEPTPFVLHVRHDEVELNVGVVGESATKPLLRSWANGSSTSLHGAHVDGLRDALRAVRWNPAVAMIHVIMHQPEFAGPTRSRLSNGPVRKIVRECVMPALINWRSENSSTR